MIFVLPLKHLFKIKLKILKLRDSYEITNYKQY